PVVAVVDTNCDPERVDYVIPGNDDAIRAIKLFASRISEAVIEGKNQFSTTGVAMPLMETGGEHPEKAAEPAEMMDQELLALNITKASYEDDSVTHEDESETEI